MFKGKMRERIRLDHNKKNICDAMGVSMEDVANGIFKAIIKSDTISEQLEFLMNTDDPLNLRIARVYFLSEITEDAIKKSGGMFLVLINKLREIENNNGS